jgi:hypothetical protein
VRTEAPPDTSQVQKATEEREQARQEFTPRKDSKKKGRK